jgi:hypothetical protein
MSVLVTFNSTGYLIPTSNETGWATVVTNFLSDVGNNAVTKSGGSLTLGSVNATPIGLSTPSSGAFTTLSATTGTITTLKLASTPQETRVVMAANNVDLSAGSFFTKTIAGITTFTVSNVPASGFSGSIVLELTNGGAFAVTWWAGVKWASGVAPSLTIAGLDVLGFYTLDGGTTWRGLVLARDVR